jgi:hypothetical protein
LHRFDALETARTGLVTRLSLGKSLPFRYLRL